MRVPARGADLFAGKNGNMNEGERDEKSAKRAPTVLVVDDEAPIRRAIARILSLKGFEVSTAENGKEGLELLSEGSFDAALVDLMMPEMGGLELLTHAKERRIDTEIIMMTAFADVESAVNAVKNGAFHFLTKPFPSNDAVALTVEKAAEHRRLIARTKSLESQLEDRVPFGEIIGSSKKMDEMYRLIDGMKNANSTVLILGESGTGKELVARAIHEKSPRRGKPFVAVNCAAIPKDLVESELFGHTKGAFTGAVSARAGLFESADGGTLLLDEVGDLPLSAQVKLLRVLQEGEIKRVGSDETKRVDVRVLAATNVDLESKIASGQFRSDLYYRLNVIGISLPALRERDEDIPLLAHHFLQKFARRTGKAVTRIAPDAMLALERHSWPGNVRELEHAIERAVVLAQGESLTSHDFPFSAPKGVSAPPASTRSLSAPLPSDFTDLPLSEAKRKASAWFEKAYVDELLRRTGGNISEAARQSGLDRSNFRRIVKKTRR